jgi:hypothetical protein
MEGATVVAEGKAGTAEARGAAATPRVLRPASLPALTPVSAEREETPHPCQGRGSLLLGLPATPSHPVEAGSALATCEATLWIRRRSCKRARRWRRKERRGR